MTSEQRNPVSAEWRWSSTRVQDEVEKCVAGLDSGYPIDRINMVDNLIKVIRGAETDAYHHGRRSVQRVIVSALDIQHMVKR